MNIGSYKLTACLAGAIVVVAAILLSGPRTASAEPPGGGRRFDRDHNQRGGGGGGNGGGAGGEQRPGIGGGGGPPMWSSPEQRREFNEQLRQFCEAHSPRRWAEIREQTTGHFGYSRVMGGMAMRFRGLQALEKDDPALYKIKVREIEVEDVEYGVLADLKLVDPGDAKRVDDLKGQLAKAAQEHVDLRLQERSRRIERLTRLIDKEKQTLAKDEQNKQALADEQVQRMLDEGPDYFLSKPGGGRRDGGGGGGAADGPGPGPGGGRTPATVNAAPTDRK
ncbi:MAG TPA: hypothetical protein VH475_28110 [Tepidisphaeraceae bacterium]|jgi:hypothetical protein